MGSVRTFEDLIVWQRAMDLAADVYRVTAGFPREEIYGLRRAKNTRKATDLWPKTSRD